SDTAALRMVVRPPADPAMRAAVEAARGELAEIKALHHMGRYADGIARARALTQRPAVTHYRPLEAEVLLQLGILETAADQHEAAGEALKRAAWAAEASRYDEVASRAWIALMRVDVRHTRFDDALALVPRVPAALE